jgi:hypothetical protein
MACSIDSCVPTHGDDPLRALQFGREHAEQPDRAADRLDDASIFMSHPCGPGDGLQAAIGPEVGAAHAGGRGPDNRIRHFDDPGCGALLEADIAGAAESGSSYVYLLASAHEQAAIHRDGLAGEVARSLAAKP